MNTEKSRSFCEISLSEVPSSHCVIICNIYCKRLSCARFHDIRCEQLHNEHQQTGVHISMGSNMKEEIKLHKPGLRSHVPCLTRPQSCGNTDAAESFTLDLCSPSSLNKYQNLVITARPRVEICFKKIYIPKGARWMVTAVISA